MMQYTDISDILPEELRHVSGARLVATFYDEAIAALEDAIEAIAEGDIERRFNSVVVATGVITALANALDEEAGGEIAQNLGRLYLFIVSHLPRININNDPNPARNAIRLLKPLRDAWDELDSRLDAEDDQSLEATSLAGAGDTAGAAHMTA
jgi:flagellar secretion chaperone FliS